MGWSGVNGSIIIVSDNKAIMADLPSGGLPPFLALTTKDGPPAKHSEEVAPNILPLPPST